MRNRLLGVDRVAEVEVERSLHEVPILGDQRLVEPELMAQLRLELRRSQEGHDVDRVAGNEDAEPQEGEREHRPEEGNGDQDTADDELDHGWNNTSLSRRQGMTLP